MTIEDCANDDTGNDWKCNSCTNSITYNAALSADVISAIEDRTVGCSDCASTGFLEYKQDADSNYRR